LASIALVLVGLYIRIGILEPPVFAKLKTEGKIARAPVIEVLRNNGREVALTALLRTGQHVPYYIFTTYILAYGTQVLGFSRQTILEYVMIQSLVSVWTIPFWGHLSDRYGRRLVTGIGCVAMVAFPFVAFMLADSRNPWLLFLAIVSAMPVHDMQYGPQAAFIAESFPGSLRYSGSALGYQLASITAGGPAPIVATLLYARFHSSTPIAEYISLSALISLACVCALKHESGALDQV
jgi:MFS family permease